MILLELGDGWGPVIVDDTEELHLMAEQIRVLINSKEYFTYWIGGLGYDSLEAHGYFEGKIKLTFFYLLKKTRCFMRKLLKVKLL